MTSRPWMKFYPTDWRSDPKLRMCSLAARGLWIEIIGFMHEAEPYGHLVINGRHPSEREIAALVGATLAITTKALAELRDNGVISAADDGTIFSRRMVRDREASEQGRKWVESRWANREDPSPPNRGGTAPPITPEARYQNPESQSSLRSDCPAEPGAGDRDRKKSPENLVENHTPARKPQENLPEIAVAELQPSGDSASEPVADAVWRCGVSLLTKSGRSEKSVRSVLGRLIRDHGGAAVFDGLRRCERDAPVDPVAYLTGVLNGRGARQSAIRSGLDKWLETQQESANVEIS